MSETTETEPAEPAAPTNAELDQRVTALDGKLDMILDKLGGKKDETQAAAQQHTEERLDRPSTIAEEIRAQLEAKAKADAADAEKRGHADRLAAIEATVTGMAEKVPEAPQRRVEKIMGWR